MPATTTVARFRTRTCTCLAMASLALVAATLPVLSGCASSSSQRTWAQTAEPVSPTTSTSSQGRFVSRQ